MQTPLATLRYKAAVELSRSTQLALARGLDLYARGQHWDAHEAWEDAWQEESGEVRLFLQGLIQLAAAMHKAFVQKQAGPCVRLLTSALGKLEGLPEAMGGVRVAELRESMRTALGAAERWSAGELAGLLPGAAPVIVGPPR